MLTQTDKQVAPLPSSIRPQDFATRRPRARSRRPIALDSMGALMPFARNSEIYGENEPADYLYKVVSGTVRTYKVLVDGRRQIGGFHLPGDMFGFESGDEHTFSAEAITDCKILVIKRSAVITLAARDNDVAQQMWALTARELQRVQDHMHGPDQERSGAGRWLSSRNGGARRRRRSRRASNVPPGHCRLSRSDHRNRVAHADPIGKDRRDRTSNLAPDRVAQPLCAQSTERLDRNEWQRSAWNRGRAQCWRAM